MTGFKSFVLTTAGRAGILGRLSLAVLMESLQWLIIAAVISHWVPVDTSYFMERAFDKMKEGFFLTRQVSLYRFFGAITFVLALIAWRLFAAKLDDGDFRRRLNIYLGFNAVLIIIQVAGVFHLMVHQQPAWAWSLLYAGIAFAVLLRMLLPWLTSASAFESAMRWLKRPYVSDGISLGALTALVCLIPAVSHQLPLAMMNVACFYIALRLWGLHPGIAFMASLMMGKWIFWNLGLSPMAKLDAVVLLLMGLYEVRQKTIFLIAAAVMAGLWLCISPWQAMGISAAVSVYALLRLKVAPVQKKALVKLAMMMPWLLVGFALLGGIAKRDEWFSLLGLLSRVLNADKALPWYAPLYQHQFFVVALSWISAVISLCMLLCAWARYQGNSLSSRWCLGLLASFMSLFQLTVYVLDPQVVNLYLGLWPTAILFGIVVQGGVLLWKEPARWPGLRSSLAWAWVLLVACVQCFVVMAALRWMTPSMEIRAYVGGLLILILGWVVGVYYYQRYKITRVPQAWFILVETVLTALMCCALWQMTIYGNRSRLAPTALVVLIAIGLLHKIFYRPIKDFCWGVFNGLLDVALRRPVRIAADAVLIVFIGLLIYVPDPEAAVAKMFMGEHFHHYDFMVMGPAFAWHMGQMLFVDSFSTYGFGMPLIMARLAEVFGGFGDLSVFKLIVLLCVFSYISYYLFLRYWLGSIILSLAAIFMGIKWQMFYTLAYPMTFTYANSTALRFGTDAFFLLMMTLHISTHQRRYLYGAALCAGFAAFFILSTGTDLILSFWAYLTVHLLVARYRGYVIDHLGQWPKLLFLYILPLLMGFMFYALVAREHAFTAMFWHNLSEAHRLFLDGIVFSAYLSGWKNGEYFNVWMGFALPLLELFTVAFIFIRALTGRGQYKEMFILVMAVYGYSMYAHFAALAVGNNYYMRALPYTFVLFYWIKRGIECLKPSARLAASLAVLALSAFALFTNHNYISHPNVFSFSRNPMVDPLVAEPLPDGRPYFFHQEAFINESFLRPVNSAGEKDQGFVFEYQFADDESLKRYYRRESDFSAIGQFIASLTDKEEKVALISSWDIRILLAADRQPFFYAIPIFGSRPLKVRSFTDTTMYHKDFLNREIERIKERKPRLIFVQRMYLDPTIPRKYYYDTNTEGLMFLLEYITSEYVPYREGPYITAMIRKDLNEK